MSGTSKKILVVDDEPDAVLGITAMLETGGYEVCSASDGEAGLETARKEKPDLIILDVQMPNKGGFETYDEMRRDSSLKDIPVCFLTGVAEKTGLSFSASEVGEYFGSEPEAYIEKPVDPSRLLKTVGTLLGG